MKGDTCDVCNGTGKVIARDAPFGKPFPAKDRKHVHTEPKIVDCPTCMGSGKQR